ncbi:MAG TPA: hypothetical protein VEC36_07405, partial [Patescibacteria group bacterium]|nr:hypothetical protein [Patescibacteria group bacterium]
SGSPPQLFPPPSNHTVYTPSRLSRVQARPSLRLFACLIFNELLKGVCTSQRGFLLTDFF